MSKTTLLPTLRRLVEESRKPLKTIAEEAGVDYQAFRRFIVGATKDYNATSAEKVFYQLTGKLLFKPDVPLRKSLRKGGKAA